MQSREHVAPRVDLIARRVLRLLEERGDQSVVVGRDAAEGAGITDAHQMQCDVRAVLLVEVEQAALA